MYPLLRPILCITEFENIPPNYQRSVCEILSVIIFCENHSVFDVAYLHISVQLIALLKSNFKPKSNIIRGVCIYIYIHSFIIHQYSALEAGLAGTRAQSCDRYGSGTLHPGQVHEGSLPLLSPAFRRSHLRRQVPVRPQRRERSQQRKV